MLDVMDYNAPAYKFTSTTSMDFSHPDFPSDSLAISAHLEAFLHTFSLNTYRNLYFRVSSENSDTAI